MKYLRPLASRWIGGALCGATLFGCSSQAIDTPDGEGGAPSTTVAVTLVEVYTPNTKAKLSATALAFNPTSDGELWATLRQFPSGKACTSADNTGCAALSGVVAVVSDATGSAPAGVIKQDGNSFHFMRRPTSIAWGDDLLFSTCGESRTDNYEDEVDLNGDPVPYAGPVLWSSDPAIFGVKPLPTQNGTHLDMLHETPYCMGMAHESGNAFWAFNGQAGSLDRVDFHHPHEVGGADHDDGEVHRYVAGQLLRVAEVPSHLAYDSARGLVYVADTGHGRVLAVDPSPATAAGKIAVYELLQGGSGEMVGASVTELVPPGSLQKPSGLALAGDVLYVTDNATSRIHTFDTSGKPGRVIDTALPPGSLSGIALGPDGKPYLTNLLTGSVQRVEIAADR